MPGASRTRSLVCENKKHTSVVTTGSVGSFRHSPRDWFYGFLRALPGDLAFLPPSSAKYLHRRKPLGWRSVKCEERKR